MILFLVLELHVNFHYSNVPPSPCLCACYNKFFERNTTQIENFQSRKQFAMPTMAVPTWVGLGTGHGVGGEGITIKIRGTQQHLCLKLFHDFLVHAILSTTALKKTG